VAAPIWDGGQVVGILNLDSMTPNFFSDWHAERLKAFANQAAIAIKNARMFQKLSTYSQDLEQAVQERTAQLTTAYSELEVLSRVKDEFVSNVSHELRSPLTSLMLRETLLARHPDNLDEHLPVIERETKRLQHTIDDLLRLSRLDQGRLEAVLRPLDLNELVQQLVEDRELTAQEAGLQLLFEACPDVPPVEADYGLLGQVLGILVTNAINYTPAGGRVIARVQVRSDGWAGFSIEDTGPGISSDDQARLFERFFRGNVGRQSKAHGTGLGLAIAKAIVEQHQGQIDVKSEPGQGAAFAVWLPARSSR
jgi:signal transduction histidine kinase